MDNFTTMCPMQSLGQYIKYNRSTKEEVAKLCIVPESFPEKKEYSRQNHEFCMSKGPEAEDMTLALFKVSETKVAWEQQAKRSKKEEGAG